MNIKARSYANNNKEQIKTIKIYRLFNRYDVLVDMSKECNLIIGTNGIGKTSILKILHGIMNFDVTNLANFYFDKIEISTENSAEPDVIDYMSLFPTTEIVADIYREKLKQDWNKKTLDDKLMQQYLDGEIDFESKREVFNKFLDELCENKVYGYFLNNIFAGKIQPYSIKSLLRKYDLDYEIIKECRFLKLSKETREQKIFEKSLVEKYLLDVIGERWYLKKVPFEKNNIYFSLVDNYTLANEPVLESAWNSEVFEWLWSNPDKSNISYKTRKVRYEEFEVRELLDEKNYIVYDAYTKIRKAERIKDILSCFTSEKLLRINELINLCFLDDKVVNEVNLLQLKYVKRYLEILNANSDDVDYNSIFTEYKENMEFFDEDKRLEYNDFVKPVIVKNTPFYVDIDNFAPCEAIPNDIGDEEDTEGIKEQQEVILEFYAFSTCFKEYLKEAIRLIKNRDNRSEEMSRYEELIRKYIFDKYIDISPTGIILKNGTATNDSNVLFVSYDLENIDLSVVSSGERKLLIIFAIAIFANDTVLIMDEPELSLSIVWQRTLISDLLEYGKQEKIIAATHSPYIVDDDSLKDYITFLPQEGVM